MQDGGWAAAIVIVSRSLTSSTMRQDWSTAVDFSSVAFLFLYHVQTLGEGTYFQFEIFAPMLNIFCQDASPKEQLCCFPHKMSHSSDRAAFFSLHLVDPITWI